MDAHRLSPTLALLTLARAAEVDVARILEPAGLSVRKLVILRRLATVPGASPTDLARSVRVSADEAAPMLRAMTSGGLIKRGRDGALSVTEAGSAALAAVDAAIAELDEQLFAGRDPLAAELIDASQPEHREPQD